MDKLRYPIGPFVANSSPSEEERNDTIQQLGDTAKLLRDAVVNLNDEQLQTPYRPGGWTIRQVVHHMADNDMNAYLRLKRALTEDEPVANSYREDLFAELSNYRDVPVETSITLLEALHSRLTAILLHLSQDDYGRRFSTHALGWITLEIALQRLVWHNRYHMAQIRSLREREGWGDSSPSDR